MKSRSRKSGGGRGEFRELHGWGGGKIDERENNVMR